MHLFLPGCIAEKFCASVGVRAYVFARSLSSFFYVVLIVCVFVCVLLCACMGVYVCVFVMVRVSVCV